MDLRDVIGHENVKKMMERWVSDPGFAYLFSGPSNVGKSLLAERFVRALSGHDLMKPLDIHPDIIVFLPEEGKKEVSVKTVREARKRLYGRPQVASRMVVYLPRMDWLNQEGYNALLKVMEEPPAGAVFVGVAGQLSAIPSTIMSRVVHIPLEIVAKDEIEKGLITAGKDKETAKMLAGIARGRPGKAITGVGDSDDYKKLAENFVKAKSLGARLAAIDAMRKTADAKEEPREAWAGILEACMEAVRECVALDDRRALILGQGIIDAIQALNGPVGPRVMLEGASVLVERDRLNLPGPMPRGYPLSLTFNVER